MSVVVEACCCRPHLEGLFSHSPIEVMEECLANVGRMLRPGGFFDFTFDRTEGAERLPHKQSKIRVSLP